MPPSTAVTVLGLLVVFGLPTVGIYRRRTVSEVDWPLIRRMLIKNWVVVTVLVLVVGATDGLAALGLSVPSLSALIDGFLYGFIAFGGTMIAVGLVLRYTGGVTADRGSLVVFDQPIRRRLVVAITGAVVESVFFYGFAIEALLGFGSGPLIAGAAAAGGLLLFRARWSRMNALQWLPGRLFSP